MEPQVHYYRLGGVALAFLVTSIGLAQVYISSATKSEFRYVEHNGINTDILGICAASTEKVDCWSPDGKPNPLLTNSIESYLIDERGAFVKYRLGSYGRIILTRTSGGTPYSYSNASITYEGRQVDSGEFLPNPNTNGRISVGWLFFDRVPESIPLGISENVRSDPLLIPLKVGAKATGGRYSVVVKEIHKEAGNQYFQGENWVVSLSWMKDGKESTGPASEELALKDDLGQVGYSVDQDHRMVPFSPYSFADWGYSGPGAAGIVRQVPTGIRTVANPSSAAILSITPVQRLTLPFKVIRMNPLPDSVAQVKG